MIVKGIIKSIDVQGNTCVVRMPYFETAGNDEIIATATVSNSPGSYNGYKVDDVVWVAFENDQLECPVIIGKLYLGIEAERADPRGTLNVVDSKVSRTAEIPFDTRLGRNLEPGMPKTLAPYNSLNNIANNLSTAEVNIAQNDREYGNRFSVAFENIEGNRSSINQTADKLSTEISERKNADTSLDARITQTATDITNEVAATYVTQDGKSSTEAFGWRLKKDKWEVYKKVNNEESNVLEVDENGLTVTGTIEAESGHIGSFTIGEEINSHSGIFSDGYKDKNNNNITSFKNNGKDWIFGDTAEGVYVGTDGIRLGKNFSVDPTGEVIANNLKLTSEQTVVEAINTAKESAISTAASDATTKADNAESNAKKHADEQAKGVKDWVIGDEVFGDVTSQTSLAGNFIATTNIYAKNLQVNAAQINGSLTVGETTDPIFQAVVDKENSSNEKVLIGGFKVGTNGIYDTNFINSFSEATETNKVNKSGVYIGTDGIRLGDNFSVDTNGHVTATSITLQPSNISGLEQKLTGIDGSISDINNAGYQTAGQVTQITNDAISTAQLNADNITSGTLTVGDKFSASVDSGIVKIGSFTVDSNSLSMGLYDEDGEFIGNGQIEAETPLGKAGSLIICNNGSGTKADIGGSGFVNGWYYTAGSNFGVRKGDAGSEFYASKGKIGGFTIDSNSISHGTLGSSGLYLGNGTTTSLNIAGSGRKTNWRLVAGNSFGVDNDGNLYANYLYASGGKIGDFNIQGGGLWVTKGDITNHTSNYSKVGISADSITLIGCDMTTSKFSTREYENFYIEMSRAGLSSSKVYRTFAKNKSWTEREYVSIPGFRQDDAAVDMKNIFPATLILYKEVSVTTKRGSGWFDGVDEHYYGSWTVGNNAGFPTKVEKILTVQAVVKGTNPKPPTFSVNWAGTKVEIISSSSCTVVVWAVCYAPTCKE